MYIPKTSRRKGFHTMKIGGGVKKPKLISTAGGTPIKAPKLPKLPKLPSVNSYFTRKKL